MLGPGSRLPVACLSLQERHALMRWVAACTPATADAAAAKLQRDLSHIGSPHHQGRQQQQQQHQADGWEGGGWGEGPASPLGSGAGSSLLGLSSPRGDWPSPSPTTDSPAAAVGGALSSPPPPPQQQQRALSPAAQAGQGQGQQAGVWRQDPQADTAHLLQELKRLQQSLGQPAQQEWVTTCGQLPAPVLPAVTSTAATAATRHAPIGSKTAAAGARTAAAHQQASQHSSVRLKPAVAAAVAAVAAGSSSSTGGGCGPAVVAGLAGPRAPVPPSRLYVQEADGEMRLATVLVSQQGL